MGMLSLREKLLQAGLVTEEQAKRAEADRHAPKKGPERASEGKAPSKMSPRVAKEPPPPRELSPEEKIALEESAARREHERFLAKEREENRKRALEDKKRQDRLRELAGKHGIEERGEETFHFLSRKNRVLRIYLTAEQTRKLEVGELAIIENPLPSEISFAIVPRAVAEEALAIDRRAIRFFNRGEGETYGFKAAAAQAETSKPPQQE